MTYEKSSQEGVRGRRRSRRRAVDNPTLERWRQLDALLVLREFAGYIKQDLDFKPRESVDSTRWFATVGAIDFELLCTGPKFLDVREQLGGGGAVDLVMHLLRTDFTGAVLLLEQRGL